MEDAAAGSGSLFSPPCSPLQTKWFLQKAPYGQVILCLCSKETYNMVYHSIPVGANSVLLGLKLASLVGRTALHWGHEHQRLALGLIQRVKRSNGNSGLIDWDWAGLQTPTKEFFLWQVSKPVFILSDSAVGSLSLTGFCLAAFWVCGAIWRPCHSCEDQQGEPEVGWLAELSSDPPAGI